LAEARRKLQHQNEILKENIELQAQIEQITQHDLKNSIQVMLGAAQLLSSELPHPFAKVA
jgi:nitrogen-specific signal transduction histidine kinase